MKNLKLLTVIATCLLLTSVFAVIPVFSVQPPVDTSTYYLGTIGQPARVDPCRAYDTASGELLQNVYQTLIWYADKHPIAFTPGVGYNLTTSDISDLTLYTPVIATEVPTIANGRIVTGADGSQNWTFTINTNAQFTAWYKADGTYIPRHNVTVEDVVYSFQRQLVFDSSASPDWMWLQTAFNPGWWTFDDSGLTFPGDEAAVAALIQSWVYPSGGNDVTFHMLYPYPPSAMYQIFSQTWGAILQKAWVIEHGGWTGSFASGWAASYRRKPSNSYSELDQYKDPAVYGAAGSKYTSGKHDIPNMTGTGPYRFTSWDKTTKTWRIDRDPNYWMGWANAAGPKNGQAYLQTVISKGIDAWPTRKMLFLEGEFDVAVVPRANMYDLLLTGQKYTPIAGINMAYNIPALSNDAFFFTMNESSASSYQSYVGYPHTTGAISTFFADQHIRRAFAWAIDYATYISAAYFGEAVQHGSWWVTGLTPPGAEDSFLTLRNINTAKMLDELSQAALINGRNVSQDGFDTTFLYNIGNDQRRIAAEALANAWTSAGVKYHVSVVGIDWPVFLDLMVTWGMPGYSIGWLADFADAVDFCGVYMSSSGSFSYFQGTHNVLPFDPGSYPADQSTIDAEVTAAGTETDETTRVNLYKDLETRYYEDCISLPLDQPVGRRFARDWVYGWYYNPILPGNYFYDLYKVPQTVKVESVTIDVTHTITPIVTQSPVYIFHGQMRVGNGNSGQALLIYQVIINRTDNNLNAPHCYTAVGLNRTCAGLPIIATYYGQQVFPTAEPNATYVDLIPLGSVVVTFWWAENGVAQVIFGNTTGVRWTTGGDGFPSSGGTFSNVTQSDLSLLHTDDGVVVAQTLQGDITGEGVVDIYDAVRLAGAFGYSTGQTKYNADADLNTDPVTGAPTPDGTIDIYDAVNLARNFGHHVP